MRLAWRTMGLGIPLCELHVVVPMVRYAAEAIPLRDDIEEHKEAFFDTYIGADLRFDVREDPV